MQLSSAISVAKVISAKQKHGSDKKKIRYRMHYTISGSILVREMTYFNMIFVLVMLHQLFDIYLLC